VIQRIHKGFSLIELLAIITIMGVLSVLVIPRLSFTQPDLFQSRVHLVQALNTARHTALFSSTRADRVQLSLSNNTISIRKNMVDINRSGVHYSNILLGNVRHEPQSILLSFNNLGETQAKKISLFLGDQREDIVIHSTGFVQ